VVEAYEPILRAIPEVGDPRDDPSEDAMFLFLEDIEAGSGTFLIVERTADPDGLTYIQTLRQDDGSYIVEHREGGQETHLGTTVPDMREAHRVLTAWAFELPDWADGLDWSPVSW
jgi:hypothetical protein